MYVPIFIRMAEMLATAQVMLSAGQFDQARVRVDKVRQLRSTVKRQMQRARELTTEQWGEELTTVEFEPAELLLLLKRIDKCAKEISVWLTSVIQNVGREELLRSDDGINLLLDLALPPVWDFNNDIVVLSGENNEHFAGLLAKRRQAQIIIVSGSSADSDEHSAPVSHTIGKTKIDTSLTNILHVTDSLELSRDQLESLTKRVNPELVSIDTGLEGLPLEDLAFLARNIWKEYVYPNSTRLWSSIFTTHLVKNLPSIYRSRKLSDLRSLVAKKDILIVSPGPSLLESLPQVILLKKYFVIVSLVRSLPVLLDAGVIPNFVIMVDASDHTDAHLNLIPENPLLEKIPLLVTDYTHASTLETNFSEFIFMPSPQFIGSQIYRVLYGDSPPSLFGGGVATFAVSAFAELGVKSITLVGQDLSISDRTYASEDQSSVYNDELGDVTCLGINGERLTTQADFAAFIKEFGYMSKRYSREIRLINATAYGAFLNGWEHIPLDIEHPAVTRMPERITESTFSNSEFLDKNSLLEQKSACINALASEIELVNEVAALAEKIVTELKRLIQTSGIDVAKLEALEEQLNTIMKENGALIAFYTMAAKLDVDAELSSVSSLEENFIVSLDYYGSIETYARRLVPLLAAAKTEVQT